ncbi:Ig-like domain-containing protein [Shewanella litorisediminis]|uniref:Ig-like domain-containing protein n=1 Tax=Shewanella litorisediminis TaxID=1173586 RepID=A0ABX7G758_9GAMM|nr:invasin domain 3-containing protein [Shewanella litorisediminis]MCL2916779.1 Ig-like domain-containing protein [Shewanella litorisediminis]QRH03053.1 Ig-like domain-containing protein [Shewanella litorisediminis]
MKSAFKLWLATFLSFLLIACGGGGSISDTGGGTPTPPPTDTITVTAAITFSSSNSTIGIDTPATVTANVKGSISGAKAGKLVTFKLNDATLGTFTPSTGTALTDADGNATITLSTADIAGAGTVTASVDTGEASEPVGFTMKGDGGSSTGGEAQVSLTLTDADGAPTDTISSTKPGKLVATVSGISKTVIVTFNSSLGDLPIKTAITDANGKASVDIYAGSQPGAAEATATLSTGESGQKVFVIGASNVLMGTAEGDFVAGKASVSASAISAGGTATVSIKLQDDQDILFTEPVSVSFSSTCATKGQAELSSPVTAVGGIATSTYLAKGCVGDDNISVSADVGGKNLSATGTLNVLAADAGSIVFVGASPENISIKGTGGDESSTVKFKVLDTNGNPVANKAVSFALNTSVGGLTLSPATATTNSLGIAQTVVTSGAVATTVRVTASIDGTNPVISSQSSVLVISTGKPDQDSFSLSAEILNAEGWEVDGTEVKVTARLADAFNNPVPDGTAVYFTTEGGSIDPSCTTANGGCTVVWRSQNARPDGVKLIDGSGAMVRNPTPVLVEDGGRYYGFYGQKFGGRATITATAVGEESFPDTNGNGRFDAAEMTAFLTGTDVSGDGYDLADAFVDHNEDGVFNPQQAGGQSGGANEELVDFDVDGQFDAADGKYNGVLCSVPAHAGCASSDAQSLFVRRSLVLVMSGSEAFATAADDVVIDDRDGVSTGGSIDINGKSTASVVFAISDLHNQQMPAGTIVQFTTSAGSIASTANYTWPSSNYNGARQFSVTVKGADQPESGVFSVTVTTPGNTVTEVLTVPVNIY